jgi:hypothetical protein
VYVELIKIKEKKLIPLLKAPKPNNTTIINSNQCDLYYHNLPLYNNNAIQALFLSNVNYPFYCSTLDQQKYTKESLDFSNFQNNVNIFDIHKSHAKNIVDFMEVGHLNYFYHFLSQNIKVKLYTKNITLDYYIQSSPDILLDFSNSKFRSLSKFEHVYIGIDQKTSANFQEPQNKLLNLTTKAYRESLEIFSDTYQGNLDVKSLQFILNKLTMTCDTPEQHLEFWLDSLEKFDKGALPPLRQNMHFNPFYLKKDASEIYNNSLPSFMKIVDNYFSNKI